MPFALRLADLIFLTRVDVGVIVVDCGCIVVGQQPLDDGAGTWGAAGMKEKWGQGGGK